MYESLKKYTNICIILQKKNIDKIQVTISLQNTYEKNQQRCKVLEGKATLTLIHWKEHSEMAGLCGSAFQLNVGLGSLQS